MMARILLLCAKFALQKFCAAQNNTRMPRKNKSSSKTQKKKGNNNNKSKQTAAAAPTKKQFLCKNYLNDYKPCSRGKSCPFTHLQEDDHAIFQELKSFTCFCNPKNAAPIAFTPSNNNTKTPIPMECLAVFEIAKQELVKHLGVNPSSNNQLWLQFAATNVCFVLQPLAATKCLQIKTKFFEQEQDPWEMYPPCKLEEVFEQYDVQKAIPELWAVIGEKAHQHCILRYLDTQLTNMTLIPPLCEVFDDEFKRCLFGVPSASEHATPVKQNPILQRIVQTVHHLEDDEDEMNMFGEEFDDFFDNDFDDDDDDMGGMSFGHGGMSREELLMMMMGQMGGQGGGFDDDDEDDDDEYY